MDFTRCVYCQSDLLAGASVCRYCTRSQPVDGGGSEAAVEAILDRKFNKTAIIALISSALWLFGIGSAVGIILGHQARAEIDAQPQQGGRGAAIAAIWTGWTALAFVVLGVWVGTAIAVTGFLVAPPSTAEVYEDVSNALDDSTSSSDESSSSDDESSSDSADTTTPDEDLYLNYDSVEDCVVNDPEATYDDCQAAFDEYE